MTYLSNDEALKLLPIVIIGFIHEILSDSLHFYGLHVHLDGVKTGDVREMQYCEDSKYACKSESYPKLLIT